MQEFVSFESFEIQADVNRIVYRYSLNGQEFFDTSLKVPLDRVNNENRPFLQGTAFALGMCLMAYFYCPFSPPLIRVRAGHLSQEQLEFWEALYNEGLMEHFYVQKIDLGTGLRIRIVLEGESAPFPVAALNPAGSEGRPQVLALLGLGKDCAVLAELLRRAGAEPAWLYFEEFPGEFTAAARYQQFVTASAVTSLHIVAHDFQAKPAVAAMARYAGTEEYVIYSCLYTFSAVLMAQLYGYNHIAVGNERSANEGNLEYQGRPLNHQLEKSLRFERLFARYVRSIAPDLCYFSGLMHLWELQIVQQFALLPQYHPFFMSCNQPAGERWCNSCPKCLQTYVLCSAFLPQPAVVSIFGENLLERDDMRAVLQELLGRSGHKPLECVATPPEIESALALARGQQEPSAWPLLLAETSAELQANLLTDIAPDHDLPAWYGRAILPASQPS